MKHLKWLLVFILIPILRGQTIQRLEIPDYPDVGEFFAIAQDSQGFIWLGSDKGLLQYDGNDFNFYETQPWNYQNPLIRNRILAIHEILPGQLFLASMSFGLIQFDLDKKQPQFPLHDSLTAHWLTDNRIRVIYPIDSNTIWLGTLGSGIYEYNHRQKKIGNLPLHATNQLNSEQWVVRSILRIDDTLTWVATFGNGIFEINTRIFHFRQIEYPFPDARITDLKKDKKGRIWISTMNGLFYWDRADNSIRPQKLPRIHYSLEALRINCLLIDRNDHLWIGSHNGLIEYNPGLQETVLFQRKLADYNSLSNNQIYCIFQDRSDVIWIGTKEGLNQYDPSRHMFKLLQTTPGEDSSIIDNVIYSLFNDSHNRLWAGSQNRLYRFKAPNYQQAERRWLDMNYPLNSQSNLILCIEEDASDSVFWIGSFKGLYRFDEKSDRFHLFQTQEIPELWGNVVHALLLDRQGRLWVGTGKGITCFDREKNKWERIFPDSILDQKSIPIQEINTFAQTSDQTIYAGTAYGLCAVDFATKRLKLDERFPRYQIKTIQEEAPGIINLGTASGLYQFNTRNGRIDTVREEFSSISVQTMLKDSKGIWWIASRSNLIRYNPENNQLIKLTKNNGLAGSRIYNACAANADGVLFFSCSGGANYLSDKIFDSRRDDFPTIITQIIATTQVGNDSLISDLDLPFKLSHQWNSIKFEFSLLDYRQREKICYLYRLLGVDSSWDTISNHNQVIFPKLVSGDYQFQVKGLSATHQISGSTATAYFRIIPPFWQTLWFNISAIVTAITLLILGYRLRVRQLKSQKKRLAQLVQERTRELEARNQELMKLNKEKNHFLGMVVHDLRNPLTILRGNTQLIEFKLKQGAYTAQALLAHTSKISSVLDRITFMVNELLDLSSIESGTIKIHLRKENYQAILQEIYDYHHQLAIQKNISLSLQSESFPPIPIDKIRIHEVLDNLVSNAIKFTNSGGNVVISCERHDHFVKTSIIDSGQGLSEEDLKLIFNSNNKLSAKPTAGESSHGLGLAIAQKLVELHHGEIKAKNNTSSGATFYFTLPTLEHLL